MASCVLHHAVLALCACTMSCCAQVLYYTVVVTVIVYFMCCSKFYGGFECLCGSPYTSVFYMIMLYVWCVCCNGLSIQCNLAVTVYQTV